MGVRLIDSANMEQLVHGLCQETEPLRDHDGGRRRSVASSSSVVVPISSRLVHTMVAEELLVSVGLNLGFQLKIQPNVILYELCLLIKMVKSSTQVL